MSEFDWIARYFAPLASNEGLGLRDDAALFKSTAGKELVITSDAITAGIHFFADDAPASIAQKLLRVNLSDLAAKGAEPRGYLLSLLLPFDTPESWVEGFVTGLASDQIRFGIALWGGDTSQIKGPITASVTAIGEVKTGQMLRRSGAQIGDVLYMTGGLGNAALGLKIRKGELEANDYLLDRYLHPRPQVELGQRLVGIATAAMDISDGLVQDAGHLAIASDVALAINVNQLTFSRETRDILNEKPELFELCLSGGDDYELLFTAPLAAKDMLISLSERTEITITAIGTVGQGSGVTVLGEDGRPLELVNMGWQHF
ncbi:MAG: thiamine-phosphate kinase [Rickettsiales bacterium]|nr:thiamine-phosphate kinase [Rickettsiales bacterium]